MNQRENVLVTGGCGFIGSHLVDRLILEGHAVYVVDNMSTGLKDNMNERAHYFFEDINSYKENSSAFQKIISEKRIKVVYHLAALTNVRESLENPLSVYETNVLASIAIADVCKRSDIRKFVFASTSAVYGEPEYFPVDETHPTHPMSPYGLSKLAFEQYLEYGKGGEMSVTVFRLPNVYGPRQRPDLEGGVVAIFWNQMKHDRRVTFYGDGTQSRDWVHVNDIIDCFLVCTPSEGPFDLFSLGSGKGTQLQELYSYLTGVFKCNESPLLAKERSGDIKHMVMSGEKVYQALRWKPRIDVRTGIHLLAKNMRGASDGKK